MPVWFALPVCLPVKADQRKLSYSFVSANAGFAYWVVDEECRWRTPKPVLHIDHNNDTGLKTASVNSRCVETTRAAKFLNEWCSYRGLWSVELLYFITKVSLCIIITECLYIYSLHVDGNNEFWISKIIFHKSLLFFFCTLPEVVLHF